MRNTITTNDLTQKELTQMAENYLRACTIVNDIRNEDRNMRVQILEVEKHAKYAMIVKIEGEYARVSTAQNRLSLLVSMSELLN